MLSFSTEQQRVRIGDLEIGGQPGERPPIAFGTAFLGRRYWTMDKEACTQGAAVLRAAADASAAMGVPFIPDVAARDLATLPARLEVVAEALGPEAPFAVDIPDPKVRAGVLEELGRRDLLDRCIYNSLNLGLAADEREMLASNTPAVAILLAFNPRDTSTDGRLAILEDGAGLLDAGLLDLARDLGIRQTILDTAATPFGSGAAESLRAIPVFKTRFGLPTGCSLHNTLDAWGWMRRLRKENAAGYEGADAAAAALQVGWGADYVLYGRVDNAARILPALAFASRLVAEGAEDYFGIEVPEDHPARRLA